MKVSSVIIMFLIILTAQACYAVGPGLDNALEISTSGIIAQQMKMNAIANNIANVDTTRTAGGGAYRRQKVIFQAREFLRGGGLRSKGLGGVLGGVQVAEITEDNDTPLSKVYDPAHPQADAKGFVYYPNVNMTEELVDITQASGAFETNVIVFNTTKQMMQTALELGR